MGAMAGCARVSSGGFAALFGAALSALLALGCDTGGLIVATGTNIEPLVGHSSAELVSGGTVASNGKYKVVYVLGQPSPMQGVSKSPDHRVNGGLVGAVQDK